MARLTDNPYRLLAFCDWAVTDRVACQCGGQRTDRRRLEAALVTTLQDALGVGHTALPRPTASQRTSQRTRVPSQVVSAVFPTSVVVHSGGDVVQLPGIASQERTIAKVFASLLVSARPLADRAWVDQWLDRYTARTGWRLDDGQRAAVHAAVARRLLVLTGGPGTGKTTPVDAIRSLLHDLGQAIVMATPTG